MKPTHEVKMATAISADVDSLLDIFDLRNRHVAALHLKVDVRKIVELHVVQHVTEKQLAALVAEFRKNPPKTAECLGMTRKRIADDE